MIQPPRHNRNALENQTPSGQPPMRPPKPPAFPEWFKYFIPLLAFLAFEKFAPDQMKPSTLSGNFVGNERFHQLMAELDAAKKTLEMQTEQNAKMQKDVEYFRARTERVTEAYKGSYNLNLRMKETLLEAEKQFLGTTQQFVQKVSEKIMDAKMADEMVSSYGKIPIIGEMIKPMMPKFAQVSEASGKEAIAQVEAQTQHIINQMRTGIDELIGNLPTPDQIIRDNRLVDNSDAYRQAYSEYSADNKPVSASRPTVVPSTKNRASVRMASINKPKVFVRSKPTKSGDNGVCVLQQGAVVSLLSERSADPNGSITFVHVGFNRQRIGYTEGWVSERVLDEFTGTAQDANNPQVCEDIVPG